VTQTADIDQLCVNSIRFLSVDAVQKANSGHPGLPLDAAPMAYVLWTRFLKYSPQHPDWFDRDRFILSAGHGSALLYSLLYLTGYDLSLEDLKEFRQWDSRTPGHPERLHTPGVEVTTGPLGQGFANGVGMAIAERYLSAAYNRPDFDIIDHYTYSLVSDGDMMEGIASEAASLAGHLKLGKLIYFYDANHVSLSAGINATFTEDNAARFEAYGWHVQKVDDGNDLDAIEKAVTAARKETSKPSLLIVRTHLGYGSPNKQDSYEAHGSPLGEDEVKATKKNLNWPDDKTFYVPDEALEHFREAVEKGRRHEDEWNKKFSEYEKKYPTEAKELKQLIAGELAPGWDTDIPTFTPDDGKMATRVASQKVINAIAPKLPGLFGGSADLDPSTHSVMKDLGDFQNPEFESGDTQGSAGGGWSYKGRNVHFGVREHAMGGIINGIAAHGGLMPYAATFLIFSDYMRPTLRLAALMELGTKYIFTHDSIGLGEDGPTHQSVEQIPSMRAIPNFMVIRPCDANETAYAWRIAVHSKTTPVALIFTRQKLPVLDRTKLAGADGTLKGAYVLADTPNGKPDIILIATGSEVSLVVEAREVLEKEGIHARVVSMPSWELFEQQSQQYRDAVLPPEVLPRLAVEAASPLGWRRYVGDHGDVIGVERFGASAPGDRVMKEYGFSVDNVCEHARSLVKNIERVQQ